jgi:hypothetical protein
VRSGKDFRFDALTPHERRALRELARSSNHFEPLARRIAALNGAGHVQV